MKITQAVKSSDALTPGGVAGERNINLPNLLTLSRILVIPVFVVVFSSPTPVRSVVAAGLFLLAALTDVLDGYLARRRSQVTRLGRLLDPIADKLLVLSGLILLVQFDLVAAWVAILIIAREVAVTAVRALAAIDGIDVPAETLGKYKMAAQVIAIVALILGNGIPAVGSSFHLLGTVILYVALVLGLVSGGQYVVSYWRQLSTRNV